MKEKIIDHYGDEYEGVPITDTHQREQKGLAHALLTVEDHIDDDFMLTLGNNIFQANHRGVVRRQREERADAAFLVEEVLGKRRAATASVIRTSTARSPTSSRSPMTHRRAS